MGTDPETLVALTSTRTAFEAETIAGALHEQGVQTKVFGLSAEVLQGELGYRNRVDVMVRRGDLERAREVLKAVRAESAEIDWSEVDVGDATPAGVDEAGRCRACGYDVASIVQGGRCPECGSLLNDIPSDSEPRPVGAADAPRLRLVKILIWVIVACAALGIAAGLLLVFGPVRP